jgi:hypothetical protein
VRRVGVALVLAALVWASGPYVAHGESSTLAPLRAAGTGATYVYSLPSLKSCEVGDGLTLTKVAGPSAIRVTNAEVLYGGGATPRDAKVTYLLISFRRGTTEGQVAASFKLGALRNGANLGPVYGGVLEPLASSQLWYDIVARVQVIANHATSWSIQGLRVTYRTGTSIYTTTFRQSVKLPRTKGCAVRGK